MANIDSKDTGDSAKPRPPVQSPVPAAESAAAESTRGETAGRTSRTPTELPAKFGRYRVKKKLGGGGMGTVYLVENTELEREEALKVPHFSEGDDPQLRERFLREAKSAAKLDHANLCPIYDAGVLDGIYYLTMRFLKGTLLSDYTGQPQSARKSVEVVTKLARALEAAHAKGVIHRDLKPSNIMMVGGVGPVVMDFGLAKLVKQAEQGLTQSGVTLGTPSYMPPEQVSGDLEQMGPASDVYSLGVILYELLTGRLPFEGSMGSIFGQILYVEPPLPSTLVPGLNPALDGICRKAMAKASTERYPTMKAFAIALMDYLRRAPATEGGSNLVLAAVDKAAIVPACEAVPNRPPAGKADIVRAPAVAPVPGTAAKVPPRVVEAIPVAAARSSQARRVRPSRLPWVLGGVAVLLIGMVGAYFLASIILRVETKAGTVLLEIDEKDAEVFVDGDKITIGRPGDKDAITVEAKEGKHLLRVTKEGFEAWTDEITFRANEPNSVKISLKPVAIAKERSKKDPATNKEEKPASKTVVAQNGPLGMKFAKVPKATFWIGGGPFTKPSKQVTIAADFEIAVYTVTQAQWQEVMGANPSHFSRLGGGKQAVQGISDEDLKRFPVESVSWNDIQEFLKKLNEREKERGWLYRLPSDPEWEHACRGGATSKEECSFDFYFKEPANDLSSNQANFNGAFPAGKGLKGPMLGRTQKVGSYEPNKLGLYDMHGNVWHWCADLFDGSGSARAFRGGSWDGNGGYCSASLRYGRLPTDRVNSIGFRLARVPSATSPPSEVKNFKYRDGPLGMMFVKMPKGTFWMGWDGDTKQSKQVPIAADFELAAFTVTQAQWQEVMGDSPSLFSRQGEGKQSVLGVTDEDLKHFPVENISWDRVQDFLKKLNDREKGRGWSYRLPSEAEWEYACRGGATSKEECSYDFYFKEPTNDLSWDQASFAGGFPVGNGVKGVMLGRPQKVGSYVPNKLGLYDMHGNVWHWCSDLYDGTGGVKAVRGGGWNVAGAGCRAAFRGGFAPAESNGAVGFRLVRVP